MGTIGFYMPADLADPDCSVGVDSVNHYPPLSAKLFEDLIHVSLGGAGSQQLVVHFFQLETGRDFFVFAECGVEERQHHHYEYDVVKEKVQNFLQHISYDVDADDYYVDVV